MKLYKYILTLTTCLSLASVSVSGQQVKITKDSPRVFINPGHGGHDSDDRPILTYNEGSGKKEQFYESNSNINEGMALRDILKSKKYQVFISRVNNTTDDDLNLFEISQMALNCGADIFYAIHSNSTGSGGATNFPLAIYKGFDGQPANPGSQDLAKTTVTYLQANEATTFARTGTARGDWSFYHWGYKSGLGVLRWNKVPGILVEDCFHDYQPERERLLNKDYSWHLAWLNSLAIDDFFGQRGAKTGVVAGIARYDYGRKGKSIRTFGKDSHQPVNGLPVLLIDANGHEVATFQLDNLNDGFFVFTNVKPGHYTVEMDGAPAQEVTVTANKSSYCNIMIPTKNAVEDSGYDDGNADIKASTNEEDQGQ